MTNRSKSLSERSARAFRTLRRLGVPGRVTRSLWEICLYDQTLYVSELTRGVRQVGISNPSSPANLGLIRIDGNHDTALRGTTDGRRILYADSYADLIVLDVTKRCESEIARHTAEHLRTSEHHAMGRRMSFLNARRSCRSINVGGVEGCWGCSESGIPDDGSRAGEPQVFGAATRTDRAAHQGAGGSMARFAVGMITLLASTTTSSTSSRYVRSGEAALLSIASRSDGVLRPSPYSVPTSSSAGERECTSTSTIRSP